MYFIDLSMRNPLQGYVDSVELIAEVTGAPEIYGLWEEAKQVVGVDSEDSLDALYDILRDAEDIAFRYGYCAFAFEGVQYVMTEEEHDELWNEEN